MYKQTIYSRRVLHRNLTSVLSVTPSTATTRTTTGTAIALKMSSTSWTEMETTPGGSLSMVCLSVCLCDCFICIYCYHKIHFKLFMCFFMKYKNTLYSHTFYLQALWWNFTTYMIYQHPSTITLIDTCFLHRSGECEHQTEPGGWIPLHSPHHEV